MVQATTPNENNKNLRYTLKLDTDRKADLENVQNIKTSELRYRRLFEAAQDGILLLDAKTGMITDVNPYLVKMLGYTREEFIKKGSGRLALLRISKPARKHSKSYRRMNIFATKICRLERKTAS